MVEYSNVTLQFINTSAGVASTAVTHFGPQAIHGSVSKTKADDPKNMRDDKNHR